MFADGMMTSQTKGVGSPQAATWNYSFDQNTLGIHTITEPSNGSSQSTPTSYTDWYPTGSQYGNIQCTLTPDATTANAWDVTSYTYNSYNEQLTVTTPLEQALSTNGQCNTGTPTYQTTYYYGSANGNCPSASSAWLLQCEVKATAGSPATLTTKYTYGGGGDTNVGDVTTTTDPNGNATTVTYNGYGDRADEYRHGQ